MLIERRKFILGGLGLIAAPAIVRATSLDFGLLRGYNMDPKVLAFWDTGPYKRSLPGRWLVSRLPAASDTEPADCFYDLRRISETETSGFAKNEREASRALPLKRQLEAMREVLDWQAVYHPEGIREPRPRGP